MDASRERFRHSRFGARLGVVDASSKLKRTYLYIRQSTLYQVANNTESTTRQYDLRGRAIALGWQAERIHVIDIDQGHSGASAADREGFQHLVAEVSMGKAGIVLGLECSRLARNNADWHRLLQICAHNDCLILDEDGCYDPTSFNDRLLLGMKGQLSEAELHFLRSRLRGGILAKARRGELKLQLPIGLAYDPRGQVTLDPDTGIRGALSHLFTTFASTGSAFAVVKTFRQTQLTFPGRHRSGPAPASCTGKTCPTTRSSKSCTTRPTPAHTATAGPATPPTWTDTTTRCPSRPTTGPC